jgi:hypothetical protein
MHAPIEVLLEKERKLRRSAEKLEALLRAHPQDPPPHCLPVSLSFVLGILTLAENCFAALAAVAFSNWDEDLLHLSRIDWKSRLAKEQDPF